VGVTTWCLVVPTVGLWVIEGAAEWDDLSCVEVPAAAFGIPVPGVEVGVLLVLEATA